MSVELSAVQWVFVGGSVAVRDADLVLTILVMVRVIWLPVGMA
ncbi:hypothetical protein [Streptomyces sp. NRRL S-1448]|nr:hypothetical protein [Streptomyces sp. NRRL S-1448]